MKYLSDIISVLGFLLLVAGVSFAFGFPYGLIIAGLVLLAVGIVSAWERSE